jgi:nucleoside-diphosphate-sugar epimerase
VDDLVEGIWRLFNADRTAPLNLGNPTEFTIRELAEIVIELTGNESGIDQLPLPEDDPKVRQPDITAARQLLGWQATVPLRDGLRKTIEYFREILPRISAHEDRRARR